MECVIGHKIDYIGVGVVRDQWRRPFSNQSEANIYRDLLIRRSLRAGSTVRRRVPACCGGCISCCGVSVNPFSVFSQGSSCCLYVLGIYALGLFYLKVVLFPSSEANIMIRCNDFSLELGTNALL